MPAAYLTLSDLESKIGAATVLRLLDDDNDGVADAVAVGAVLVAAERFVAGHVSLVYPLATILGDAATLEHVRSLAIPVAVHYAFQRRTEFTTRDGTAYQGAYGEAVKTLEKVRAGKFRLDANGVPATPSNVGGLVTNPVTDIGLAANVGIELGPFTGGFGSF